MTSDSRPYRPCVGVMLINGEGRVFVGNRIDRGADDAWQMPQGGVDPGEDLLAAARRELHEETNVTSAELLDAHPDWLSYDIPAELAAGRFVSKWRGQTQKWFAFRFTGPDSEIDIIRPAGGAEKPEFDAWRWVDIDALPALIVAFKRPIYEAVVARFRSFARPS